MSSLYIRNRTQDTSDNWVLVKLGGGGGGGITAPSTDFTEIGEAGSLVEDTTSQSGEVISGSTSGSAVKVFSTDLEDVELGACSLVMRAQFSNVNSTADALIITVKAVNSVGAETLLNTFNISPNMFSTNNVWECIGMGVNFNGDTESIMRVECVSATTSTGITYKIDYVKVLPAVTALGSIG